MDKRKVNVEQFHERITNGEYRVDADAVADAILKRLLEGRSLTVPQDERPG